MVKFVHECSKVQEHIHRNLWQHDTHNKLQYIYYKKIIIILVNGDNNNWSRKYATVISGQFNIVFVVIFLHVQIVSKRFHHRCLVCFISVLLQFFYDLRHHGFRLFLLCDNRIFVLYTKIKKIQWFRWK